MLIISLVLLQLIIFAGLIFFFKRILDRNVVSATRHLEELNQNYERKDNEVNRLLGEAKQKSEETVTKARQEAEREKSEILKKAEAERDKILGQARTQGEDIMQQADKSRQLLISELGERISKEAIDKACELIQNNLPEQFKRGVHSQWTEELIDESFDQLKHLQIPEEVKEIRITSAFPLNEEQRKSLSKRIKQLLNREVTLKEETDPKIVAGLVVVIGSLVLDGSLKNRIQEQTKIIRKENGK